MNKRKTARIRLSLDVYYKILSQAHSHVAPSSGMDDWIKTDSYDINHRGISLKINQVVLPQDPLQVRIKHNHTSHDYPAQVQSVRGTRVGLSFKNLEPEREDKLRGIITEISFKQKKYSHDIIRSSYAPRFKKTRYAIDGENNHLYSLDN